MTASPPPVEQALFSGPIELLADEVRRQNVALEQIAMAPLAARFLAYVHGASSRHLNFDVEWLYWAATLIQWKSRALLPPDDPRDEGAFPDPVHGELIAVLRAHRQQAAEHLAERKRIEETRLSRPPDELFSPVPEAGEPRDVPFVSVWDLIGQARDLARSTAEYRAIRRHWREIFAVEQETVTVAQMSGVLREALGAADPLPLDALPLLFAQPTPAHRACLFLGLLEMTRDQEITIEQPGGTGGDAEGIWITGIFLA